MFIISNILSAQIPSYVPINGLVGYWPFNGNANDISGNGNNGIVDGATLTTDRFGNSNQCYYFNGINSGIQIDNTLLSNTVHSYSINFWCKLDTTTLTANGYTIFDDCDLNQWYNKGRFFTNSQYFTNYPSYAFREYMNNLVIDSSFNSNTWVNYCCIFDYENLLLKLYRNGILVSTSGYAQGSYTPGDRKTQIGRCQSPIQYTAGTNYTSNWLGKIDDFGVWNRVLTDQEIDNLYNANICYQNVTVTDTLIINTGILSYNPLTYNNTITIYPNPANDHITIDCGTLANVVGYSIKITNTLGQEVFNQPMNTQQYYVPLNSWTGQGVYFVNIIDSQGHIIDVKKIILQ